MKRILGTASALALSLPALPVLAQDAMDLGTITIYANQTPSELARTGSDVSVLTEEQLQDAPATTLADTLDALPGVTSAANGGPGQTTSVRLRGLPAYYAPVYLNGIEVTDASSTQTSFNFANVLPGGVTRAEVIRGAQSALYGANAVAGVIALDLGKAPETPGHEGTVSAEVGSYGTKSATLSYGVAGERWGLALSASRFATDGFSAVEADGYDEADGYAATQLGFDTYFDATDDLRIGLSGFSLTAEGDYDALTWGDEEGGTFDTDSFGLRAYAQLQTGAVAHELSLSRFRIERTLSAAGYADDWDSTRDKAEYHGTWEIDDARSLSFGIDHTVETAGFTAAVYDEYWSRVGSAGNTEVTTTDGLFAEYSWAMTPSLDGVFSIRHDEHSEFGGFWSGRAALAWRATDALTLRGTLSRGFRAPSAYELYDPTYGNGDLDPETSRGGEIGADYAFANGATLGATLFYTEIDDLIQYSGTLNGYDQVSGTSVSKGVELTGSVPLGQRLTLNGSFTYTDARDSDDDPLTRVPRYDLSVGLDAQITETLSGGLQLSHKADMPDTYGVGYTEDPVDDYTVVNAQVSYEFRNGLEAYLRVENLFDEQYQVIPDYQTSDRAAYFGIRASF